MGSFDNTIWGSEGMQYLNEENKNHPFGTMLKFIDGQEFIYAQAGGLALAAGTLQQQAVVVSGHEADLAVPTARSVGDTTVTLTNSTTAITANQYAEGYLFVNDAGAGTGEGYKYKIKSNLAESTGSGVATFVFEEGSALRIAWTTATQCGLRKYPTDETLIAPTAETGVLVGVAVRVVTANFYCWLQKKGPCVVLTNGTLVKGSQVSRSTTTPGAVDTLNGDGTVPNIGECMSIGGSTEYSLISLDIR